VIKIYFLFLRNLLFKKGDACDENPEDYHYNNASQQPTTHAPGQTFANSSLGTFVFEGFFK